MAPAFKIDLSEEFLHLSNAPVVEAVIDIRARAQAVWEEKAITEQFRARMPEYPSLHAQMNFQHKFAVGPGQPPPSTTDISWQGLRFQSSDQKQVVRFDRSGFAFSRLQPYTSWEQILAEALPLWDLYVEVARPAEIQRVGLRFINRISLPMGDSDLKDYLRAPPQVPDELALPFIGFFHQDLLIVPETSYSARLITTIQPPQPAESTGPALIFDIDCFSNIPFEMDKTELDRRLQELHWLKNKVFFKYLTPQSLEIFQ